MIVSFTLPTIGKKNTANSITTLLRSGTYHPQYIHNQPSCVTHSPTSRAWALAAGTVPQTTANFRRFVIHIQNRHIPQSTVLFSCYTLSLARWIVGCCCTNAIAVVVPSYNTKCGRCVRMAMESHNDKSSELMMLLCCCLVRCGSSTNYKKRKNKVQWSI